jgi:hypothetical protein
MIAAYIYVLVAGMGAASGCVYSPCSADWSWRLELEWCERKILLPGWWLEDGAGVVYERNTVGMELEAGAEHGDSSHERLEAIYTIAQVHQR